MIYPGFQEFQTTELDLGRTLIETLQKGSYHPASYHQELVGGFPYLFVNNAKARVLFARVFLDVVTPYFGITADNSCANRDVYFVTLALCHFSCPLREAACYGLEPLQAWVRGVMQGFCYIGYVEAAFYTNQGLQGGTKDKTVSWHVHLFVWNKTRAALKAVIDEINANYQSLVATLSPADYRRIAPEQLIGKALYLLKSPREYRVWPKKREAFDPETGENTIQLTGRFRQKSRPLRPVDQVRVYYFMRDRYLDHLMLAGGAGNALLTAIRQNALEPLRFRQRQSEFG